MKIFVHGSTRVSVNFEMPILFPCACVPLPKLCGSKLRMDPDQLFEIVATSPGGSRSRNTRMEVAEIRFQPLEEAARPDLVLEVLIQHLLDRVLHGRAPPLRVGLQLHPPGFDRPFTVPLRPPEQNNAAALAAAIERLNEQSEASIDLLAGTTVTKVVAVWPLEADRADQEEEGHQGACALDTEHRVTPRCQSLIRVHNPNDRLCLARATLLGLAHRRCLQPGGGGPNAFRAYARTQHRHGPEARNLLRRAGIPRNKHMYGLEDVKRLQRWADARFGEGEVRLVVVEKERQYKIVYKGQARAARFNLCLYLERAHFHYVARFEQLLRVHQFCFDCEHSVRRWTHWIGCKVTCRMCFRYGPDRPCQGNAMLMCQDCHFPFPNADCFAYHRLNRQPDQQEVTDGRAAHQFRSICEYRRRCLHCGFVIYTWGRQQQRQHLCQQQQQQQPPNDGPIECAKCKGPHGPEQPCFIQPLSDRDIPQLPPDTAAAAVAEEEEDGPPRKRRQPIRLCFFDAETSQVQPLQVANRLTNKHVPMLLVAEVLCEFCIQAGIGSGDEDVGRRAQPKCVCGTPTGPQGRQWCSPPFRNAEGDRQPPPPRPHYNPRRLYFHAFDDEHADPVGQFLDFLTRTGPRGLQTICIAHNGGKYDFHLVLEALHARNQPPNYLCSTGLKIYSMHLRGHHQRQCVFKDSLNYFFCELDALPRAFGLPAQQCTRKPFFPYMLIRRDQLHQRVPGVPPAEHYQPQWMKPARREEFLRWHAEQMTHNNTTFQLREQLILYCANDVAILRESVLRFRRLIADHTQGIDPFQMAATAAGLAMATMRRCFLPANTLVHSPEGGYLRGRRASVDSQRYIRLFELEHPESAGRIQCAQWAIGEAHVEDTGYRLDGLWHRHPPLRPLAIEFMGCFYHGCPQCYPARTQQLAAGRTAEQLFYQTKLRLWELETRHGYQLHIVWGHELAERLKREPDTRLLWHTQVLDSVTRPLDPREDALRGGRTEPFRLHYVCSEEEEIICIDIVSLYPYVMKALPFPVGNPRVITRETLLHEGGPPLPWRAPQPYRGLLLVRVLPPLGARALRVPLLPYRTRDGRLAFPLCARCADNCQQRACRHTDRQRSWTAAYTHAELNRALELGYLVIDVFEVWHYEQWNAELFRPYVDTFVQIKVQASGWPPGCETEEQHRAYLDDFERVEGIRLDPALIENNPALRMMAKILLNCFWGKLAQRVGGTEIRYARTPAEFHELFDDPTIDILDFDHVSEHMDRLVVRPRPEFAQAPKTNCLPIAIFVTSYARLHLYRYMEQVQQLPDAKLLYVDTDSIYYVNRVGAACVPEGEALGQMKREHTDRHLYEFVSGGPKNYGFRHRSRQQGGGDERAQLKVRSFRLSYNTEQLLNFDSMRQLVLEHYNIDGPLDDTLDDDGVHVQGGNAPPGALRIPFPQIGRTRVSDLYTVDTHKDYRPHYQKGRVRPGMQTLPFGYRVEDNGPAAAAAAAIHWGPIFAPPPPPPLSPPPPQQQQQLVQQTVQTLREQMPGGSTWTDEDYLDVYAR